MLLFTQYTHTLGVLSHYHPQYLRHIIGEYAKLYYTDVGFMVGARVLLADLPLFIIEPPLPDLPMLIIEPPLPDLPMLIIELPLPDFPEGSGSA